MKSNFKPLIVFVLLFISCNNEKYEMATMTGAADIDVTSLVKQNEYIPVFCNDKLIKLKKTIITPLSKNIIIVLNNEMPKEYKNLDKKIQYEYSYIIYEKPVDVYTANFKDEQHKIYFRIDYDGVIIKGFKIDEGWVTSSCD